MRIGIYEVITHHEKDAYELIARAINMIEPTEVVQIRDRTGLDDLVREKSLDGLIVHWAKDDDVKDIKQAYPNLKVAMYCGIIQSSRLDSAEVLSDLAIGEKPDYVLLNLTSALRSFMEFLKQK